MFQAWKTDYTETPRMRLHSRMEKCEKFHVVEKWCVGKTLAENEVEIRPYLLS